MTSKVNFDDLTFDRFRELAASDQLSRHEKVGFPNEYRDGKEEVIFQDVINKLSALDGTNKIVIEIGPGCSNLPVMLAELCRQQRHQLHFVDSAEMLSYLPEGDHIHKWAARYPEVPELLEQFSGKVDAIVAYSVIQYVFAESNLWEFLDCSLSLLRVGGQILMGDIPNITMRKRFFASSAGIETHKKFTGQDSPPIVHFNQLEAGRIDDSVVLSILARARLQGFHAWVIPQGVRLPMANRREDILIVRP